MTPRELIEKWRRRPWLFSVLSCAEELEAALAGAEDAEHVGRTALETELWAIIDRDGFAGIVPSDIHDAVSRLVATALAAEWMPLADAPLGVPLELWGWRYKHLLDRPYPNGGWCRYAAMLSEDDRAYEERCGATHARRPPPPGESDARD